MQVPQRVVKIAEQIRSMRIRGAGRIARAAAFALKVAARNYSGPDDLAVFKNYMSTAAQILASTRPTAVSLHNAIRYVMVRMETAENFEEAKETVISAADRFITTSLLAVKRIGEIGSKLLEDGDVVMTHCNSSAALSVIRTAHREGKRLRVYTTETRPKFQGLISYRTLAAEGIKVTMIPDSAVRFFMRGVDKVVVGADTITSNGAVVNKVGTSLIALAAQEARVRFYVAAETYKFSPATVLGELVTIEERPPDEVLPQWRKYSNLVRVRNPAFDVTPPEYIDAIITEQGIIPPRATILILLEEYGASLKEELDRLTLDLEDSMYHLARTTG